MDSVGLIEMAEAEARRLALVAERETVGSGKEARGSPTRN